MLSRLIPIIVLLLISFIFLVVLGPMLIGKKQGERFSLMARPPFELIRDYKINYFLFGLSLVFIVAGIGVASGFLWMMSTTFTNYNMILFVLGFFMFASLVGVFLFDFRFYKYHFVFFGLSAVFPIIFSVTLGAMYLQYRKVNAELGLLFAIVSFVFAIPYILIVMNPKFATWSKLDKVENDGAITYVRPKRYVVAYSEWAIMIIDIVLIIFGIISYYFIGIKA